MELAGGHTDSYHERYTRRIVVDCFDANTAVLLVDDALEPAERAAADEHIAECASCRRLVAELARSVGDDAEDEDTAAVVGSKIGRYELRGFRGRGGMGAVYDAYDPKLDRLVALKLVKPSEEGSGTGGRARLIREAHALAKLAHPNVVSVFDVGDHGDHIYIAMELVEGVTLRVWLAEERSLSEILETFAAAGRGLAAAHEQGMVHRDFKPDNVLVGDDGRVRVVDFGLVRAAGGSAESSADVGRLSPIEEMTRTGTVVGTPAYMAPEQHSGGVIDQRADQFSFAVALFEALYGLRPFAGESLADVLRAAKCGEVREVPAGSNVPRRIHAALIHALAAQPDKRFSSMSALLQALSARSKSWLPLAASAGGFLVLASIAAVWFATSRGGTTPCGGTADYFTDVWSDAIEDVARKNVAASGHRSGAEAFGRINAGLRAHREAWQTLHQRACRATHIEKRQPEARFERQLVCLFDRLERSRVISEKLRSELGVKDVDELIAATNRLPAIADCDRASELDTRVPLPPADRRDSVAAVRASISRALTEIDMAAVGASEDIAERIVKAAKDTGFDPVIAEAMHLLGRIRAERGEHEQAEEIMRKAVTLAAKSDHDPLLAALWVDIIATRFDQGEFTDAIALAPVVEAALVRADSSARLRARGLQSIAEAYWWKPDYELALDLLRESAALIESTYGETDPDLPVALALLAEVLTDNDSAEQALPVALRSAALAKRAFGIEHSVSAWSQAIVGLSLRAVGRYKEAKVELTESYERLLRIAGEHPERIWIERELGHVHYGLGEFEASVRAYQAAADKTAAEHGADDYRVSLLLRDLAKAEAGRGQFKVAREALEQALAIRVRSRGAEHPMTAQIYVRLGELDGKRGRQAQALAELDKAEAIYRKAGKTLELSSVKAHRAIILYGDPKQRARALELAKDALREFEAAGDSEAAAEARKWLADKL